MRQQLPDAARIGRGLEAVLRLGNLLGDLNRVVPHLPEAEGQVLSPVVRHGSSVVIDAGAAFPPSPRVRRDRLRNPAYSSRCVSTPFATSSTCCSSSWLATTTRLGALRDSPLSQVSCASTAGWSSVTQGASLPFMRRTPSMCHVASPIRR